MIRAAMITTLLVGTASLAHAQGGTASLAATSADPLVRVTQLDSDSKQVGVRHEMRCPPTGCQLASILRIGQASMLFQTVVTFAGQGVYVVLEAPHTGMRIYFYGDPRPAPLFLPKSAGTMARVVHIAIDPSGARRLAQAPALALQDTWLRIEIDQGAPVPRPAS